MSVFCITYMEHSAQWGRSSLMAEPQGCPLPWYWLLEVCNTTCILGIPTCSLREEYYEVCRIDTDPHAAASTMAIQYASVRDVLRKMCPRVRTSRTCECSRHPSRVTRSCNPPRSRTSSSNQRLGPSPPIRNCSCGKASMHKGGSTVLIIEKF